MLGALCVILLAVGQASFVSVNLVNSKTYQSKTAVNATSRLAIDGNTKTCSVAEGESSTEHPWWRVKLDRLYNITDLSINFAINFSVFMNNLNVYISKDSHNFEEQLCNSIKLRFHPHSTGHIHLNCVEPKVGQFVTIKRIGGIRKNLLVLCEIFINADKKTVNLAFKRPTFHSGLLSDRRSALVVDNNLTSCALITVYNQEVAWLVIILDRSYYITDVNVYFTPNISGQSDYRQIAVYISKGYRYEEMYECGLASYITTELQKNFALITCKKPLFGLYVTIKKHGLKKKKWLILCEVEIFSKEDPTETTETQKNHTDCLSDEYKCRGGDCIHQDWICDGTDDCPNAEDEAPTCRICPGNMFKCAKRNYCIPKTERCDGQYDCPDLSDEHGCFSVNLDMGSVFLKATYEGNSYYVCSKNWKLDYSYGVCRQHRSLYLTTEYAHLDEAPDKVLTIMHPADHLPSMQSFSKEFSCISKTYVKIQCEKQEVNSSSLCGTRASESTYENYGRYIINGKNAKPGAWPWHVQIFHLGQHICGGSIISDSWILTAAHCLQDAVKYFVYVKVGSVTLNDPYQQKLYASFIIKHPEYGSKTFYQENDVALIKLKSPIVFTQFIRPICLPSGILEDTELMSFQHCIMTGFGHIDRQNSPTEHLQQGRMNLMTTQECKNELSSQVGSEIPHFEASLNQYHVICAGSVPSSTEINNCMEDSGGPLVCKDENGIWTQVGIAISFMKFDNNLICSNNLFVRVDHYADIIYQALDNRGNSPTMEEARKKIILGHIMMNIMIFLIKF